MIILIGYICIPLVYRFFIISLFVFVWEGGIGYRYLCIRIIKVVYIIRIRICDKRYLILFVGWDWWVFSLCMRIRMVIRDRITFRYVIFMVVGLYRLWLYHLDLFVISLLTLALWILSEDDFCLFLGGEKHDSYHVAIKAISINLILVMIIRV